MPTLQHLHQHQPGLPQLAQLRFNIQSLLAVVAEAAGAVVVEQVAF
jgi:hypothetical protein